MAAQTFIHLLDSDGNKLTVNEAAKLTGEKPDRIRHCIRDHNATTIDEIRAISENLKRSKMFYASCKLHKTKYGPLTTKEIHERHPHRDKVSQPTISERIRNNGAMHPGLWGPPKKHSKTQPGGAVVVAVGPTGDKKRPKQKNHVMVKRGDEVISKGLMYVVTDHHDNDGANWLVSGHRKMPNGDVLVNTTHFLGTNWEKANEKQA